MESGIRASTLANTLVLTAVVLGAAGCSEPASSTVSARDASVEETSLAGCVPTTCAGKGAQCGSIPDGCGQRLECGSCESGATCGGGGPNKCGPGTCMPKTCAQLAASCGYASDLCAEAIDCGACPAPATCGGTGVANQCGCVKKTCAQVGATCGSAPDGCGGEISCGQCSTGQTCGGGGANKCGTNACAPRTCAQAGAACGVASDGCSDVLDCGACTAPGSCGGGGWYNQCGCTKKTCAQLGRSCGSVADGCGSSQDCGGCPAGSLCISGQCSQPCGAVVAFKAGAALQVGQAPGRLRAADFDGDGLQDLAVVHGSNGANALGVIRNLGGGKFAPEVLYPCDLNPTNLTLGDLDADGKVDALVTNYGPDYVGGKLTVLLGKGDGTLTPAVGYDTGDANPMTVELADFDGDGRRDAVVSHNNGQWSVRVMRQGADGALATAWSYPGGQNPQQASVGDLNGDGAPDVVVGTVYSGFLSYLNKADKTGALSGPVTVLSGSKVRNALADLDQDGDLDVAVSSPSDGQVFVLFNDGAGAFPTFQGFPVGTAPDGVVVTDLNRDGKLDIVVANSGSDNLSILHASGKGAFLAQQAVVVGDEPLGVDSADFDGDGRMDLAVSNNVSSTISVLLNDCVP